MTTPAAAPVTKLVRARKRGEKSEVGERMLRRIAHGRKEFFHRTKNGVYDPITYFHVVDALLVQGPDVFRTRDLTARLRTTRTQLAWDVTTVGRVLADIAETLQRANGSSYISTARRWNGMIYAIDPSKECRAALLHLMDDLILLCDELIEEEQAGTPPKRLTSPLERCPSVSH
jgi:hypothetical protein